jgi:hypothetical protein
MTTFSNNLGATLSKMSSGDFVCELCDYTCCKKYNFDRHILSTKHLKATNGNKSATKNEQNEQKGAIYCCDNCNKEYNDRSGLWRHKQKCKPSEESDEENTKKDELAELVKYLMKENSEMKNMMLEQSNLMMEVIKNGTMQNSHNTTTSNSHNKAFNLQFFLNETCKDAMNITDFVESIKLQLSDLERVGELGYVEGISNIIVKNLKDLDVTQRPVHCTDQKRETMYVKDEDKWEKDEEQKKMHKLVRKVADKNARMVPKFKEAHPDCGKSASRFSDQYNKIIMEAMGGKGDNDFEKEEKIIKKVSKEVTVEKNPL